jgi:hypothetical protein
MNILKLSCLFWAAVPHAFAEVSFDYNREKPLDIRETGIREQDGVTLRDITYASLDGSRNAATIIAQKSATGIRPAILFVHWYGSPDLDDQ